MKLYHSALSSFFLTLMKPLILFAFAFLTIVSVSFQSLRAQAPIPNGDFEDWNGNTPTGWLVDDTTVGSFSFNPITQTSDAHSGSSALAGSVVSIEGFAQLAPVAITGSASVHGFPYTDHPNSFTGYYKFNPAGGDSIIISCVFEKSGTGIGAGGFSTRVAASGYTAFAVPIYWSTSDAPDTSIVSISVVTAQTGTASVGSAIEVDDLAYSNQIVGGGGNAVAPSEASSFELQQNYPNPLTNVNSTNITYSLNEPGYTTLTVYDINGRTVATPAQEVQSAGNHLATLDCSQLPAGVYTYRLTSGGRSSARMMQVLH
jgi:hypothetical protein